MWEPSCAMGQDTGPPSGAQTSRLEWMRRFLQSELDPKSSKPWCLEASSKLEMFLVLSTTLEMKRCHPNAEKHPRTPWGAVWMS